MEALACGIDGIRKYITGRGLNLSRGTFVAVDSVACLEWCRRMRDPSGVDLGRVAQLLLAETVAAKEAKSIYLLIGEIP